MAGEGASVGSGAPEPAAARVVGDLVQIDGSPHEGRGPVCTLIVYIDDATSRLLALGFFAAETTEAYMKTTRAHLAAHGRPVAYYSDRYGVFRVNEGPGGRVDAVLAGFADARHRGDPGGQPASEGARGTGEPDATAAGEGDAAARDRRHGAGNAYLPEFMADFNRRFAVAPRNPADAHRAVLTTRRSWT